MNKKTSLKLDDFSSLLEKLAEKSDSVYWLSSPDFKSIIYISPAYEKIWGRSRKELYRDPSKWIEYLHPEDAREHHPIFEMANRIIIEGEEARFVENYRIIKPNGEIRWIIDRGFPLYDAAGICLGVTGVAIDVTKEKKYEDALREALEAKSTFIANMSHDVRTPLTGVIGLADILEKEGHTAKDRELGHAIHASAESLLQLLDDILDVVSVENYENLLQSSTFNLRSRLNFLINLMTPSGQQHKVELSFEVSPDVPEYIISDRIKIDRILINLISNAIKFTPSGSIKVFVKTTQNLEQQTMLEFRVKDTGIGIPQDQFEKIFERLYRIGPSYKNKYKGHGIGLFIVQKYVQLLKGEISVESNVGEGTTFIIMIPLKVGNESEVSESDENNDSLEILQKIVPLKQKPNIECRARSLKENFKSGSMKVLIIEDEPVAKRVVKTLLVKHGFEIEEAENAEKGFWLVMQGEYNLIITDIGLPGMNGYEFASTLRAWEKATKHKLTPIVGLTAHGTKQKNEAKESVIELVFSKPLSSEKINQINERFFKNTNFQEPSSKVKISKLGVDLPGTEEELFELENYPLLNEKEGLEVSAGDSNFFKELIGILTNETLPEELAILTRAHQKGNWDQIQSTTHKIKGGALYCGTIRLRYASQYLERYRLAGHSELLEPLYQQLLTVIEDTQKHLKIWLNNNA